MSPSFLPSSLRRSLKAVLFLSLSLLVAAFVVLSIGLDLDSLGLGGGGRNLDKDEFDRLWKKQVSAGAKGGEKRGGQQQRNEKLGGNLLGSDEPLEVRVQC